MSNISPLQQARLQYIPVLPSILQRVSELTPASLEYEINNEDVTGLFPKTKGQHPLYFKLGERKSHLPCRVGVVLSGGQAPGGHNVISGLYDALKILNEKSQLFGFCQGPEGIIKNKFIEITGGVLASYRNQGGFDLIGSGRTKIETPEQFQAVGESVRKLELNGLVVIGGDDSNTNAALLAEYFETHGIKCSVIGVPKTIDGDLKNSFVDVSFGFDTACKTYSEIIGNIMRDAISAKKYYYFIKLMGRSASHITLECALQTHPNMALIGEEVEVEQKTLMQVIREIADLICDRSVQGKDYGVILIPEGIVEFIPEVKLLIDELNILLANDRLHQKKIDSFSAKEDGANYIMKFLSTPAVQCFNSFPKEIQFQLMIDRDPHGNVQVSKIETERLLIELVKRELKQREQAGKYQGKFSSQPLFCGYEGRSGMPSNFDSQYCYALGYTAALLVDSKVTGYMSYVRNLSQPVEEWQVGGVPLVSLMAIERRHGKEKPVIKKAFVELDGKPFVFFKDKRAEWMLNDAYRYPGPIQFFGPKELTDSVLLSLRLRM